jgi:hypothetical protein
MSKQQESEQSSNPAKGTAAAEPSAARQTANRAATLLSEHKGKLAVGAAAMLGLAVFYKWREGRLAKEDPDEYARLRRLKAAVEHDPGPPRSTD